MAGLAENLKAQDGYYLDGGIVPQNTTLNSSSIRTELGGINGAQEVYVVAATDIVLADTKTIAINIEDSADDSTFVFLAEAYAATASGETTIDAGTEIGRVILPTNARTFTRVAVTTTDATATGTVDSYLRYIAR